MRLSVIIPVYNGETDIRRCLESVCIQLQRGIEVLLLDDGSTDSSLQILQEYKIRFPDNIRIRRHTNHGAAYTRNRGIEEASGDYICFIDQDDYIDADFFERYLGAVQEKKADIFIGGYKRVSNGRVLFRVSAVEDPWYPYTVTAPWARLYRREYLMSQAKRTRFLEYPMGEDVYFNLGCYQSGARIVCVDYNGYNWYYNENSISNTTQRGFNDKIKFVSLLDMLYSICDPESMFAKYFLVRYSIWYLLFSGKAATKKAFMQEYKKILVWMKAHDVPFYFPGLSKRMRSERWAVRISTAGFLFLHKIRAIKVFASAYCKGRE